MAYNELTPDKEAVSIHKTTGFPFTGKFLNHKEQGVYVCRQCNELDVQIGK